jgi:hypothetical protein
LKIFSRQNLFSLLIVEMVNYFNNCCPPLVPNAQVNSSPSFLNLIPASATKQERSLYIQLTRWVNSESEAYWEAIIEGLLASSTYTTTVATLNQFVTDAPSSLVDNGTNSPRLLITAPGGNVLYDSSKGTSNTFARSSLSIPSISGSGSSITYTNPINDNHNTRASIMTALLMEPTGYGYQSYYSTSVSGDQSYVARRIGTLSTPYGVVRVSADVE